MIKINLLWVVILYVYCAGTDRPVKEPSDVAFGSVLTTAEQEKESHPVESTSLDVGQVVMEDRPIETPAESPKWNTRGPKMELIESTDDRPEQGTGAKVPVDIPDRTPEEEPLAEEVTDRLENLSYDFVEDDSPISYPDHSDWSEMLSVFVDANGSVNYAGWKKEHQRLKAYLELLNNEVPAASWPRNEAMAYWINAYNAFTVDLILTRYPVASILDLDDGKTWDVKRIKLAGKSYSLNQIEHDILRPRYKDARIHFAVNCAAVSCPKLKNSAWTAETLEEDLESATRLFVNNERFNKISSSRMILSRIFDWYRSDFEDLAAFIDPYVAIRIKPGASVEFMEYDWELNGR